MEIKITSSVQRELIDITHEVQKIVNSKRVENGMCYLFLPHTTAGLFINENHDPDLRKDFIDAFNQLVPVDKDYRHAEGMLPLTLCPV